MLYRITSLFACVIGVTLSSTAVAEPSREWNAEQLAIIEQFKNGPVGLSENFERWESTYSQDWSYWRVGDDQIRDRKTHMERVRTYVEAGNRVVDYKFDPVSIDIIDDVALFRFIAEETILETTGEEIVVRFSTATLLVKEDGVWKNRASNIVYLPDE